MTPKDRIFKFTRNGVLSRDQITVWLRMLHKRSNLPIPKSFDEHRICSYANSCANVAYSLARGSEAAYDNEVDLQNKDLDFVLNIPKEAKVCFSDPERYD